MKKRRMLRYVIATTLVGLVAGCGPSQPPTVGSTAPSFSLQRMDGTGNVSLRDLTKQNEPIILNAWASWCGPCQAESPDLEALAKQYQGKVQVIGINMTSNDSLGAAKQFVRKYGITYPVLMDTKANFLDAYAINGFPATFLLDSKGVVEKIIPRMATKAELQVLFQEAVNSNRTQS